MHERVVLGVGKVSCLDSSYTECTVYDAGSNRIVSMTNLILLFRPESAAQASLQHR